MRDKYVGFSDSLISGKFDAMLESLEPKMPETTASKLKHHTVNLCGQHCDMPGSGKTLKPGVRK